MPADVVIVGAGSAGCVLATRLSEERDRHVILLESGPDYPTPADLPPEIRSGLRPVFTHDWGYRAETALDGRVLDANRARIVGGCSATNAALAVRGRPADELGRRRPGRAPLSPISPAPAPRANLTVRSDALVDRIELAGTRAVGVRLAGSDELVEADRVILAAGSYGSPAILLRSGVGPAGHFRSVGVEPVLDLPGVGANLTEHPLMPNVFEALTPPRSGDAVFQALLTAPSATADGVYLHVLPLFNPPELQGDPPVPVILTGGDDTEVTRFGAPALDRPP